MVFEMKFLDNLFHHKHDCQVSFSNISGYDDMKNIINRVISSEGFIIVKDRTTKKKLRKVAVDQEYVELAPVLMIVCSNTSRSTNRYGMRGREFYSIIDGAFASMIILLSAVNEGIGAAFVGAFEDDKVSQILQLPKHVKPVGIICLGYPAETPEKLSRIDISKLVHYEKW
jgi:nitroreductase